MAEPKEKKKRKSTRRESPTPMERNAAECKSAHQEYAIYKGDLPPRHRILGK